jgi:hypothetical protein
VRGRAVGVQVVVRPDLLVAVLLVVGLAGVALAAAPDDDAYTDHVAGAVLGHLSSDLLHLANHLMTGFTTKHESITQAPTNPYLSSAFTAAALQSSDCKFDT